MEQAWKRIGSIFRGNRRQMLTAAAAVFIVYVLLLAGIFSYFHSADLRKKRLADHSRAALGSGGTGDGRRLRARHDYQEKSVCL